MKIFVTISILLVVTLSASEDFFIEQVKPLLSSSCVECHNDKKSKGGLKMHTYAKLMEGGETDLAINLKAPEKSLVLERCLLPIDDDDRMPPKGEMLSEGEISVLKKWITLGAPWPKDVELKAEPRRLSAKALTKGLVSIEIFPKQVKLNGSYDKKGIVVLGHYGDEVTHDLSHVAMIDVIGGVAKWQNGNLVPVTDGKGAVVVEFAKQKATVDCVVTASSKIKKVSFRNDVMPVLTAGGCNMGSCHGSARGQDGFRLSLFGFDPEGDFHRLMTELPGRRVNLANPDQSLFISKSVGAVPHTGGKRISTGSLEYQILLDWVKEGAVFDEKEVNVPVKIEVFPKQVVLHSEKEALGLRVFATYKDGTSRDVTRFSSFSSSNDNSVVIHKGSSTIITKKRGEAFVMARFHTFTEGTQVIVIPKLLDYTQPKPMPENYIDTLVLNKLHKLRIEPSPICDDATFIRRLYIDLVGKLPEQTELNKFVQSKEPKKRSKLIDKLLERKEFTDLWVMKWSELLQIRTFQNQVSYKSAVLYHQWLSKEFSDQVPFDQITKKILASSGGTFSQPQTNFYQVERDTLKLTENVAQVFMGTRIQCAQCHNHPFDRWTMDDYYGFASFFAQVKRKPAKDYREQIIFDAGGSVKHPVTKQDAIPKFLGGETPKDRYAGRRKLMAEWMVSQENPWFAKNVANIIWAQYLGVGIVEPVDDVRVSNPPSNPELLDALAKRFVESNYSIKAVVRDVCNSRTYQLSTSVNSSNKGDQRNFSHSQVRRIRAEVLLDMLAQVTQTKNKFKGLPLGARAVEIADGNTSTYFLKTFGRASRGSVCSCEVKMEPNLSQALHLLNGDTVTKRIYDGKVVQSLVSKKLVDKAIVENLYQTCLGRLPTAKEWHKIEPHLKTASKDAKVRQQVLEDIFWAILNSKEFVFTH